MIDINIFVIVKRYPKMTSSLYMQEKSFKDRTKKIIESKEKEIVSMKQKVAEMSLRYDCFCKSF